MARNEHAFSAEVRKDLEAVYGENIHVNLIPDMIRTGKKFYDFYYNYCDHFTAIEAKYIKGQSLNLENCIKPHQPGCLKAVENTGGSGLFLVGHQESRQAFIFDVDTFYQIKDRYGVSFKILLLRHKEWDGKVMLMNREKVGDKTRWCVETLIYASKIF